MHATIIIVSILITIKIPDLTKLTSNKLLPQLKLICFSLIQVLTSKNK